MRESQPPVVLLISGNDPSGGAGLAADIQAVSAAGAHPAPVVAALTVQDSHNVLAMQSLHPDFVVAQAQAVLNDMPVAAIKLGLLASAETGRAVAALLALHPALPVVVDPVLAAGGGTALADDALLEVYRRQLFPRATLVTPNAAESRRLIPGTDPLHARAAALLKLGARYAFIKGADEDSADVHNHLFGPESLHREFTWPRLPGRYHGSGCTLASAIASRLAFGMDVPAAVDEAQHYTWEALRRGWALGRGQLIPDRRP